MNSCKLIFFIMTLLLASCGHKQEVQIEAQHMTPNFLIEQDDNWIDKDTEAKVLGRSEQGFLRLELVTPIVTSDWPENASRVHIAVRESADRFKFEDRSWEYIGAVLYTVSSADNKITQPVGRVVIWKSARKKEEVYRELGLS